VTLRKGNQTSGRRGRDEVGTRAAAAAGNGTNGRAKGSIGVGLEEEGRQRSIEKKPVPKS